VAFLIATLNRVSIREAIQQVLLAEG